MNEKREYFDRLQANIDQYGFHLTYVGAEVPYSYTVGMLTTFGLPELFISSLPPNLSQELTTQYLERHRGSKPALNQVLQKRDERFEYILIPVPNVTVKKYALSTFEHYSAEQIRFLQLIYPDVKSRFPHDFGYDYDQEILGQYPEIGG